MRTFLGARKKSGITHAHERKTLIERNKYDFYSQHPETASFLNWVRMVSHFLESAKSASLSLAVCRTRYAVAILVFSPSLLFGQTLIGADSFYSFFVIDCLHFACSDEIRAADTISSQCVYLCGKCYEVDAKHKRTHTHGGSRRALARDWINHKNMMNRLVYWKTSKQSTDLCVFFSNRLIRNHLKIHSNFVIVNLNVEKKRKK